MTEKTPVTTSDAPSNDLPYSQGVLAGELLFISGQGPTDPKTMEQVADDIGEQTRQTISNVEAIVEAGDGSLSNIVKVTVYLDDMDDYSDMNEVYGEYFDEASPARVCIEAGRLPGDIGVEIEAIAYVASNS